MEPQPTLVHRLAGTRLSTPARVSDYSLYRGAQLSGEALFDVAHDVARILEVVAGGTTVRAVGTQFDVDRRPNGTTVVEWTQRKLIFAHWQLAVVAG
jgi:hypothetical protein